jgi:hypothetical protein
MLVKCMNFKMLEKYLRINLSYKNLPGCGLTKVENHWSRILSMLQSPAVTSVVCWGPLHYPRQIFVINSEYLFRRDQLTTYSKEVIIWLLWIKRSYFSSETLVQTSVPLFIRDISKNVRLINAQSVCLHRRQRSYRPCWHWDNVATQAPNECLSALSHDVSQNMSVNVIVCGARIIDRPYQNLH